ncbi:hypothetical protein FO519_007166 [Halicephalobus sp. NKZ332]|nr:hypothetical protein FO519_007166 [Halicephalobus sp. NKZ332]
MRSEDSKILFKKFCSDFIVVEKQGKNLCGTWNKDSLKPFVECEPLNFEKPEFLTPEDMEGLQDVLGYKTKQFVVNLQEEFNTKEHRKALHLFIRQHFDNQLVSSSTETGVEVSRYNTKKRKDARIEWPKDLGKFLHFTMKKTGHEVPYALNAVSRAVGMMNSKAFNFAGSKDRRAVTFQRISAFKLQDSKLRDVQERLAKLNIELSEFSYEQDQVRFGGHDGNVFYILLRNADIDEEKFEKVKSHGCLNVFGPQRFGSLSVNTADIGLLMLKEEYETAVNLLLDPGNVASQQMKDLLKKYAESKSMNVLKEFPRHMESSNEGILIRSLSKNEEKKDKFLLALLQLPMRNRSLYLHAYQSKIFNEFAEIYKNKHGIDYCIGKEIPLPCSEVDETFGEIYEIYLELLAKDGLTLESFKSKQTNFGIHMTKRDLVILPTDMSFKKIHHADPDEEMIFYPPPEKEQDFGEGYESILLKFTLPPGGYATTVLYELYGEHFKAGDGLNERVEVE